MSLRIVADSLEAQPEGVSFQCEGGGEIIQCGIADTALRDLIDFHTIKNSEEEVFRVLVPQIERLANAKCNAGRFEDNGWLVIWPVDLLRYGFVGGDPPPGLNSN